MVVLGRVQNGVAVPEGNSALPEGAVVTISFCEPEVSSTNNGRKRIQVPLVQTGQPGSVYLTNERIAAILNDEEVSS